MALMLKWEEVWSSSSQSVNQKQPVSSPPQFFLKKEHKNHHQRTAKPSPDCSIIKHTLILSSQFKGLYSIIKASQEKAIQRCGSYLFHNVQSQMIIPAETFCGDDLVIQEVIQSGCANFNAWIHTCNELFLKGCSTNQHLFLYTRSCAGIGDEYTELFLFERKCGIASEFLPRTLAALHRSNWLISTISYCLFPQALSKHACVGVLAHTHTAHLIPVL